MKDKSNQQQPYYLPREFFVTHSLCMCYNGY